jgi:glutathione S-transferase
MDQARGIVRARSMITLYAFARIFPEGRGETKDLRVHWALEELGLPYRIHPLDHTAGDLDSEWFARLNPFRQAPVIDDDGFVLTESAAIVLYLAEKAGKLVPADVPGRARVMQWCFAAAASVEPTLACRDVIAIFDAEKTAAELHTQVHALALRWLGGVERRLEAREWIACDEFTAADIMMCGVLRTIRKTDLMDGLSRVKAYYQRCTARPAWERVLEMCAERLGVGVEEIR